MFIERSFLLSENVLRLYLFWFDQCSLVKFSFFGNHLSNWSSVKNFSTHSSIENTVDMHNESGSDFVKIKFIFIFIDCFSEDLVISKAHCLPLVCKVKHMINDTSTFWMIFWHIEGSNK